MSSNTGALPHLVIYSADTPPNTKDEINRPLPSKLLPPLLPSRTFATHLLTSFRDVTSLLFSTLPAVVLIEHEGDEEASRKCVKDIVKRIRFGNGGASITGSGDGLGANGKRVFIALWSQRASLDPRERTYWTSKGVNMVTYQLSAIGQVLQFVHYLHTPNLNSGSTSSLVVANSMPSFISSSLPSFLSRGSSASSSSTGSETTCKRAYSKTSGTSVSSVASSINSFITAPCPYCAIPLTLVKLHIHVPLYHAQESDGTVCTLCEECVPDLSCHIRDSHPITADALASVPMGFFNSVLDDHTMSKAKIENLFNKYLKKKGTRIPVFALVVCRNPVDGKYLLVDETGGQGWYLPGGGIEMGEDYAEAAERETLKETGVEITIKGILRMEYTPSKHGFRIRVVFYAEPKCEELPIPKSIPDHESSGSSWVTFNQIKKFASIDGINKNPALLNQPKFNDLLLPLRGREPLVWIPFVEEGGAIWPMSVLAKEKDEAVFIEDPWMNVEAKPKKSKKKYYDSKLSLASKSSQSASESEDSEQETEDSQQTTSSEVEETGSSEVTNSSQEDSNESHLEDWLPPKNKKKQGRPNTSGTSGSKHSSIEKENEDSRNSTADSNRRPSKIVKWKKSDESGMDSMEEKNVKISAKAGRRSGKQL